MKAKLLIAREDVEKLQRLLTRPTTVCQYCDNKVDCIGVEACYDPEYYQIIEYELKPVNTKELFRMVNS